MSTSAPRPTQSSLLESLKADQDRFTLLMSRLSDEEQQRPFTPEGWSVKDFLAHMAHWKAATHMVLVAYTHDQPPPPVIHSGDQANAEQRDLDTLRPLEEVRDYWDEVHMRLVHITADELDDTRMTEEVHTPWDDKSTAPICQLIAEMCEHDGEHFTLIEQYFPASK